jgi:glutamate-1-semialdehyde 2,1-aminomutase
MTPLSIPKSTLPETTSPALGFSGTFNAFPLSMAAGLAVMKEMPQAKYTKIANLGKSMRKTLKKTFQEEGLNIQVGGTGSFFNIHWTDQEVYDHKTSATSDRGLANIFNIGMMNQGFYLLGHPNISTANKRTDIKEAETAAHTTIQAMKPLIRERAPHLLT